MMNSFSTIEDFPAHSNFVELCLWKMGHVDVFPYVGDAVRIADPYGRSVPPLVTGTFGGNSGHVFCAQRAD